MPAKNSINGMLMKIREMENSMRKEVFITTKFEGVHCWPEAPEHVSILRNLHRHVFGVRVVVSVTHSDRDVEFLTLKKLTDTVIARRTLPMLIKTSSMSCEMLAEDIGSALLTKKFNVVSVSVDEDGENGATVYFGV
jgi:hypothetical protein